MTCKPPDTQTFRTSNCASLILYHASAEVAGKVDPPKTRVTQVGLRVLTQDAPNGSPDGCNVVTCPQCVPYDPVVNPTGKGPAARRFLVSVTQNPPTACNDYSFTAYIAYDSGCQWSGFSNQGHAVVLSYNSANTDWQLEVQYPDVTLIWTAAPVDFQCCGGTNFGCTPQNFPCSAPNTPPCATIQAVLPGSTYNGTGTVTISGTASAKLDVTYIGGGTITLSGAAKSDFVAGLFYRGSGSITLSGSAVSGVGLHVYRGGGTITLSGAEVFKPGIKFKGNGGILLGGGMLPQWRWNATGGVTLTGGGVVRGRLSYKGSGGLNLYGIGALKSKLGYVGSGTVTLSGAAGIGEHVTYVGSGTITLSGTGAIGINYDYKGSGTITLSGAAVKHQVWPYTGSGTVTLSGAETLKLNYKYTCPSTDRVVIFGAAVVSCSRYKYTGGGTITLGSSGTVPGQTQSAIVLFCGNNCDLGVPFYRVLEALPGCQKTLPTGVVYTCSRLQYIVPRSSIPRFSKVGAYLPAVTVCEQNREPRRGPCYNDVLPVNLPASQIPVPDIGPD